MRFATCALVSALAITTACKRVSPTDSPNLTAASVKSAPPITVGPDPDGISIGYGFSFRSTINTPEYAITNADCGHALRFNSSKPIAVTLPLLPFPCALMPYNMGAGRVTFTITETAPDGSGGDFNADRTFWFDKGQGAIMHVNNSSAFYRGVYTCRAEHCGGGGTAPPPSNPVTSTADLTDFKATQDSNKKLSIAAGSFAIGSFSFAQPASGSVEFTAGSGDVKVYMSKLGILTTEAAVGTTAITTGQMVLLTATAPSFPPGSIPICDLALNAGSYTIDQCGLASRVRNTALEAGPGVQITYTQGVARISTDATVARTDAPGETTTRTTTYAAWGGLAIASAALILALAIARRVTR